LEQQKILLATSTLYKVIEFEHDLAKNKKVQRKQYTIKMSKRLHPFTSLSGPEITLSTAIIQEAQIQDATLRFKGITLREPSKELMKQYLIDERSGTHSYRIPRKAFANYYIKGTNHFFEAVVNLDRKCLERNIRVADGLHGAVDDGEVVLVEKIALEDPRVQAEIKKLELPAGSVVVCDPWIWGADSVEGSSKRQYQCYLFMRDPANSAEEDGNHYAFPLAISPVVDTVTMQVTKIDFIATGTDFEISPTKPLRITKPNEYIPSENKLRTDLKPLQVVQPSGASFIVAGDVIRWQKWEFRIGFNSREGMVLYNVMYDHRPLFYRVSLSDMSIPYADPRFPQCKKQAFDLGDSGAGMMANDLKLGCDCLGSIFYRDGVIADEDGKPLLKQNAVCIHEQVSTLTFPFPNPLLSYKS
jgi:primary-amine oxidase